MKNKINILLFILVSGFMACDSKVKNEDEKTKVQEAKVEELVEALVTKIKTPDYFGASWGGLPLKSTPLIETTNFDNIIDVKALNAEEIEALQLSAIYPEIGKEGHSYKVMPAYKLKLSDEFYTIVLNVYKGDHELETVLINYSLEAQLTAHKVIAYDEIAEGWTKKHADLDNSIITIIGTTYGEDTPLDTTKFHINRNGEINQIKTKFSSDLRPGKAIQLNQIYTDTITFTNYNDDGDDLILLGNKNGKNLGLIYNWDWRDNDQFRFNHGDSIIVKWEMGEVYMAGDGETLYYRERAMDAERIQSGNKAITFLWRAEEYDEGSKQNINSIFINETFCHSINDEEKAALAYVATFIGNECFWDEHAGDDGRNLSCKILTALDLGYQCSDKHLGFLQKWFSQDAVALKKLEKCRMTPYTATVQTTFDEITILTDEADKTISVSYKAHGVNMRESISWSWTQTDKFLYNFENIELINSEKSERVEKTLNDNPDAQ